MKLLDNAGEILRRAWSVRLMVLAAALSAISVFLSLVDASLLGMDPVTFAALSALASLAAFVARFLVQPGGRISTFARDQGGAMRKRAAGAVAGSAVALAAAITFIGQWEGLRTEAYQDAVGVWTICYGETRDVGPGDTASKPECDAMLASRIAEFEAGLDACLEADVPVGMKIALVSWTYNVGVGAACRSTLVRRANAGDLEGACNELPRWNRAGGRVLRGLTDRRLSERAMCLEAIREGG